MADIDIERSPSRMWLWWLLGAVALVLLILAFTAGRGDEVGEEGIAAAPVVVDDLEPVPGEAVVPAATTPGAIVVGEIVTNPLAWIGMALAGDVQVGEVPTDRGFWIMDGGQRLFVILGDGPEEQPVDINPGQRLRLSEVTVYPSDQMGSIPGQLDADTRRIVEGQPVVLYVHESNVSIVEGG